MDFKSKEVINIQMKGRSFLSLENLSNNQLNQSHLDEVLILCLLL